MSVLAYNKARVSRIECPIKGSSRVHYSNHKTQTYEKKKLWKQRDISDQFQYVSNICQEGNIFTSQVKFTYR